ncbi:hypothetical protein I6F37_43335, partial [Bradyrhizobium sp. NBAIM08]|nr:hypothetical protein [Bradyrhizobium sp. NBAIM08]
NVQRTFAAPLPGFAFTALGASTGMAMTSCGLVGEAAYCWGYNGSEQLGDGILSANAPAAAPAVATGASMTQVAAGIAHSCGLTSAGALQCWGFNPAGSLGDGVGDTYRAVAVTAALPGPATHAASGTYTTC